MTNTPRRMVILTDGYGDSHAAKTAICVTRYIPDEVVAILDTHSAGKTAGEVLGVGGSIPVVGRLADAHGANTLLIGIAPAGGKLPTQWNPIVLDAIRRRMTVVSGLHDLLKHNAEFTAAAEEHGSELVDLRDNDESDVASGEPFRTECLRIHTIANDCSVGKMVAAVELTEGLRRAGVDAQFVATGQTGMLIAGSGCAVDRVLSDFVAGAAERLVRANEHHEVVVVEGQGSLFHPRYSGVTLSLLHGVQPDGMVLVYEMGRPTIHGMERFPLPPLRRVVEYYEQTAAILHPSRVIGVAINGRRYSDAELDAECARVEADLGVPACDVIRHGPAKLVDAVRRMRTG
ncbi:MAG: DUF1611 domain-containing protein [Thermoguttaceae bacterium]|nr:DUF1611 domain-containing protein [Thermoguttaceae bacterium]